METIQKKRIEFIDLAKGVCIILVVMGHCGAMVEIPGMSVVRMPLYFILSGLFFKTYGGFWNFTIKKTNKILIPFLFFYLLGCIAYYAIKFIAPDLLITEARGLWDMFDNRQFFNGPIWFLLCLFWCNLIFAAISINVKSEIVRIIIISVLGTIGYQLGKCDVFVPLFLDVAMTSLPFFCFGYYLKKTSLLYPNKYDKYNIFIFTLFYGLAVAVSSLSDFRLAFHYNGFSGALPGYFVAVTSVLAILFLCKMVGRLPIVSYAGRYSIVILCVHHMIYRPVNVVLKSVAGGEFGGFYWCVFMITLGLSLSFIPLCIRYIPWFVAQKDLIKEGK